MTSIEDTIRRIFREEIRAALEQWRPPAGASAHVDEHLLTTAEAAALVGAAPQTLANWRTDRTGPPFVKVGSLTRYRREDVERWIAERATAGAD